MTTTFHPDEQLTAALDRVTCRLEAQELAKRQSQAARYRLLAEAFDIAVVCSDPSPTEATVPSGSSGEVAYRAVRAELAAALNISERTIEAQLADAHTLTHHYPQVLDALEQGEIADGHVRVILAAGTIIGPGDDAYTVGRRQAYTDAVIAFASETTPARLRPIAARLAEQFSEQTIDERHERGRSERRVWVTDLTDGMSELLAVIPSVEAHAIHDRLTRIAKRLEHVDAAADAEVETEATPPSVPRDHRRADLFTDLLLNADPDKVPEAAGIHAHVHVTVTDEALFTDQLRLHDEHHPEYGLATSLPPAELAGSGPVDTRSARTLATGATSWQKIHHHPATGEVLRVERYRPTGHMKRTLEARDLHCRFPGCRAPAHRCDLDHTIDAAHGGPTSTDNLAALCRGHHTLKHHGGWAVTQHPGGVLEWRSPAGRRYRDRPPSQVRFEATARAHPVPLSQPPPVLVEA